MDNTDKVVIVIEECRKMKLGVEPPDVNRSDYRFTVDGERSVVYGLGAIKGVGQAAIEGILEARRVSGPFKDLFDFCRRIDLRKANKRVMEALVRAGSLDNLGANRATLMLQLPLALKMAEQHSAGEAAGMDDLFGMHEPEEVALIDEQLLPRADAEWEDEQRLQAEKETLGLYLTGHPIERYEDELVHMVSGRIGSLIAESADNGGGQGGYRRKARKVVVAGLVMESHHRSTPRGRMGSVLLDDRTGRMEVVVFSELYEECRDLLSVDKVLVVNGSLVYDDYRGGFSVRADQVFEFEQARETYAERIHIRLRPAALPSGVRDPVAHLKALLEPFRGGRCGILLQYRRADALGLLRFGQQWQMRPADALLKRLRDLLGRDAVRVVYGRGGGESAPGQAASG
jgi:DNA polymerase-3 subunit alpha